MMRILWFTNIHPLPVARKIGSAGMLQTGSWVDSLRLALQGCANLELGIASDSDNDYQCFEEDGVSFYNILRPPQRGKAGAVYRRWLHTTENPNGLRNCLDIVDRFKPDLIFVHGSEDYFGLIAKETSIPVVVSIQGILSVIENRFFGEFTCKDKLLDIFSIEFLRGIGAVHKYATIKKSARREREIFRKCRYFIGRTEFDKNFVSLVSPESHYYHCDDVLRPPFYTTDWTPISSELQTIYCTSRPSPYKGLHCLLSACQILKTCGFSNIELRISGQIQHSDIWGAINRKMHELDLKKEVVWLGTCSADTIASELRNANVFVLPSSIENASCGLGEAMLVGTPCVASYVGGVPSEITHGIDGLFFPSGDPYSLAGMIAKVLRDPLLAKTLSDNAKTNAQKRHDPQRIASTMMSIYSEVIEDDYAKNDTKSMHK